MNMGAHRTGREKKEIVDTRMDRFNVSEELERKTFELSERHKELECLYRISELLSDKNRTIDDVLGDVVNSLPSAMQFPDSAIARIKFNGKEIRSLGYADGISSLKSNFEIEGGIQVVIEVFYKEEHPEEIEGPFLSEERKLINMVSASLHEYMERYFKDMEINRYREQLRELLIRDQTDPTKSDSNGTEEEWRIILDILMKTDPSTLFMITRKMIYYLSRYKEVSFKDLMGGLCPLDEGENEWCGINIPNPKSDLGALHRIENETFDISKKYLTSEEILDLLTLWLKQNKARPLLMASEKMNITRSEITDALNHYLSIAPEERYLTPENDFTIRTNLIRRYFTERLEYMNIAKDYLTVEDFAQLVNRIKGPSDSIGTLGGKSSGIILARNIIKKEMENDPDLEGIRFARSWYLSSDTMRVFINYNALDDVAQIKYMDPIEIRNEQPYVEQMFKNSIFPSEMSLWLRDILRDLSDKPIIVRSSSHLEDSFGAAFSGKYKSLFLPNIGSEDERLASLQDAIAEVWASTFGPNAIEYRRERGMLDLLEYMGILIQEVVGVKVGPYYLPCFAGVGLSYNEFRWSKRIRREDGILRLVIGLGTRAVDRVADDYPTLISPKRPELRVNTRADEAMQYSQKYMDVINIDEGILETISIEDMIKDYGSEFPLMGKIFSIYRDGDLITPPGSLLDPSSEDLVVTFNGIIADDVFIRRIWKVMNILKDKINTPVDVEFASDGKNIYILQCRPQIGSSEVTRIPLPTNIPAGRLLFTANRYITTGYLRDIEYIVYVDPDAYEILDSREEMLHVAGMVSELNNRLPRRKFILMGPGRWGSRGDIKLGVPIQYQDINNTSLLIEIARKKGGYVPELSFGTHFFQDLVEAQIQYLPLYPDEGDGFLNEDLIQLSENHLKDFISDIGNDQGVIKVIKTSEQTSGGCLMIIMDGEMNEAAGYFVEPDHSQWRMDRVREMAEALDPKVHGIKKMFLIGSTRDWTAGPKSDIDILIHFQGTVDQKEDLLAWFDEWSIKLDRENQKRTGYSTGGLLDVHIITEEDIINKTSWAAHIDSLYGGAKEIPLGKF